MLTMILILTATVTPNSDTPFLKIKDAKLRYEQYIDSLIFFINSHAFNKIIFCDNSGLDITKMKKLQIDAKLNDVELECLSFQGNQELLLKKGKGYGEGEILEYIITHSELISDDDYFIKITGRLVVRNITKILSRINTKKCYFNVSRDNSRKKVDTRFYAMPVQLFTRYFFKAYLDVDDFNNYYLEHRYADVIINENIKTYNIPYFPQIDGVSGSTGAVYQNNKFKCKIKDILSKFNAYSLRY